MPLIARQLRSVRCELPAQTARGHAPVIVRVSVDSEVKRRRDEEQSPRLEDAEDLVEGLMDVEDVLERLDAEDRADGRVGQVDRRDVLDPIDPGALAEVAADVRLPREQAPQVGVIKLTLDLVRTELIDRSRAIKRLG